ncbi:MAG: thermonuclease family protein [Nitrospira sp.]|nr:thermonuclease family protein [Nitrospira sp.]
MTPFWFFSILVLVLIPSVGGATSFSGEVVSVVDGDTFDVEHEQVIERIRLHGIDAPEKGQEFSRRSRQFLETLTMKQRVTVEAKGHDKYARTIGDVFLPDGRNISNELVTAGLAWWYCRYSSDATLQQVQEDARAAKLGIWSDPAPIPPWVYRKFQRFQVPDLSDLACPRPTSHSHGAR